MRRGLLVVGVVVALAGCGDPTTSQEYVDLEARHAETLAELEVAQGEVGSLGGSLATAEADLAETNDALAAAESALETALVENQEATAALEAELDAWMQFAGADELHTWPAFYRDLAVANCSVGPDALTPEECSCTTDFLMEQMSLVDVAYLGEVIAGELLGTVEIDPITGLPPDFPDYLALDLTEGFLTCVG